MRQRLRIFADRTSWGGRIKLLILILFPAWVSSFPLFHYTFGPWLLGLLLPGLLVGFFRDRPKVQFGVVIVMMGSCVLGVYLADSPRHRDIVWWVCGWLWFCLAFAGGLQFWMTADPVAEERRLLVLGLNELNEKLEDTLQKLKDLE